VTPFLGVGVAGLLLALVSPSYSAPALLLAAAVLAAIAVAVVVLPWSRWPVGWQAAPAMAFYAVVALLEYAAGQHAEFVFLTALPVIWLALFHSRRLLVLGLVLLAVTVFGAPLLWPGGHRVTGWAIPAMAFVLSSFSGLAFQHLVMRARSAATEAAAVARQAQAHHDLLTAYFDIAACLLLVLDRSGRITLINRYAEELLGYRASDVLGRTLWHAGREPEAAKAAFEKVLAGQRQVRYEGDSFTRTGKRRRIVWTATGLVNEAGEVTHAVCIGMDVTEQRTTRRLSANVLAATTEQMIVATDGRGTFTVFNVGAERLLGYPAEEVIGVLTTELIHVPEELAALAKEVGFPSFREMLAHTPPSDLVNTREWTLVRKDGSRFPATMTVSTMLDDGEVVGYVLVARDLTAERRAATVTLEALRRERQAADRLRELDRLKGDFVAMVSHDLRTPLTSIMGNTELLLDGDAGEIDAIQRRFLAAVDRNARRLDSLVGDLLLLSRIESGTLQTQRTTVSMAEVVAGALEALAGQRAADVNLEVDMPGEQVLVCGDRGQLERFATNLVGNALKFTPPGGRVTVSLRAEPEHALLVVSDTGIGIPADELPHVFDRFFRSSRSERDKTQSTGLGLTIAKSIVDNHEGTISAHASPSGGMTFTASLPRITTEARR
jgi:hypothetical protein